MPRGQETDSEDGLEEEVSEVKDNTEYNPEQEITDEKESSDEENSHAEVDVTLICLIRFDNQDTRLSTRQIVNKTNWQRSETWGTCGCHSSIIYKSKRQSG